MWIGATYVHSFRSPVCADHSHGVLLDQTFPGGCTPVASPPGPWTLPPALVPASHVSSFPSFLGPRSTVLCSPCPQCYPAALSHLSIHPSEPTLKLLSAEKAFLTLKTRSDSGLCSQITLFCSFTACCSDSNSRNHSDFCLQHTGQYIAYSRCSTKYLQMIFYLEEEIRTI
jgi:hypothetical protein